MKYRVLGRTGITVSEIGFGAWGIGGRSSGATSYGTTDDSVSRAALAQAYDLGITLYDTSNVYGDGHSEELIGDVFAGRRDRVVVATKAGLTRFLDPPDFSPETLRGSLADSLRRLRSDYVDILQLHNPTIGLLQARPEIIACLEDMKDEGLIRAIGLSLKSPDDGPEAIANLGAAVLQINLNMLDLRALDCGLLALAARQGVGIVARTPLCFGFLTRRVDDATRFADDDHRSQWSDEQRSRWSSAARSIFAKIERPEDQSPAEIALRFCLSFPEVSSTIPGMLTPEEVVVNAAASDNGALSDRELGVVFDAYQNRNIEVVRPGSD